MFNTLTNKIRHVFKMFLKFYETMSNSNVKNLKKPCMFILKINEVACHH